MKTTLGCDRGSSLCCWETHSLVTGFSPGGAPEPTRQMGSWSRSALPGPVQGLPAFTAPCLSSDAQCPELASLITVNYKIALKWVAHSWLASGGVSVVSRSSLGLWRRVVGQGEGMIFNWI